MFPYASPLGAPDSAADVCPEDDLLVGGGGAEVVVSGRTAADVFDTVEA